MYLTHLTTSAARLHGVLPDLAIIVLPWAGSTARRNNHVNARIIMQVEQTMLELLIEDSIEETKHFVRSLEELHHLKEHGDEL